MNFADRSLHKKNLQKKYRKKFPAVQKKPKKIPVTQYPQGVAASDPHGAGAVLKKMGTQPSCNQ